MAILPPEDRPSNISDADAIEHARAELDEARHRRWLWSVLGRVSKWALAVVAGMTVVADAALRLWRALVE